MQIVDRSHLPSICVLGFQVVNVHVTESPILMSFWNHMIRFSIQRTLCCSSWCACLGRLAVIFYRHPEIHGDDQSSVNFSKISRSLQRINNTLDTCKYCYIIFRHVLLHCLSSTICCWKGDKTATLMLLALLDFKHTDFPEVKDVSLNRLKLSASL